MSAESTELQSAPASTAPRRLLVLAGDRDWALARIRVWRGVGPALWLSAQAAAPFVLPQQAFRHLGGEFALLVYDCHAGLDPDALAAAVGLVRGGGIVALLTPELAAWEGMPDPERARLAIAGVPAAAISGRYLRRFAALLAQLEGVELHTPAGAVTEFPSPSVAPSPPVLHLTPDQKAVWRAIRHCACGHPHRPLLVHADRGRGKSTLLGLAAARLGRGGVGPVLVTAPARRQAEQLLQTARGVAAEAPRFIAPDLLLQTRPEAGLLLVDEAAAIPPRLLEAMVRIYPRVMLATTLQGYEGSGRGVLLRFAQLLDRLTPGWRRCELKQPVRWAAGDPVEAACNRLLMLDAGLSAPAPVESPALRFGELQRDELVRDEPLLCAVFGLLVNAHYRTTPMDLRQLLDGPNLRIWCAQTQGQLLAVALIADEGPLPVELRDPIWRGERRPKGHLLPQTLAQHLGIEPALGCRSRRIVRIAVHPAWRRRGIGRALLAAVAESAAPCDLSGASFGADAELLGFWRSLGFQPVRLGVKAEVSSGAPSLLVLRAESDAGGGILRAARARFASQFPAQLPLWHGEVPAELVAALMAGLPPLAGGASHAELSSFAYGQRPYEAVFDLLRPMALQWLSASDKLRDLQDGEIRLLVRLLLQQQAPALVCAETGISGRRELIASLRRLTARWLES